MQARSGWARDTLYGIGLVGPALALVAVANQLDLGLDAPLYVAALMTLGFVPWPTVLALLAWAAIAAQLGALAGGRYRPGGVQATAESAGGGEPAALPEG